MIVDFDIKYYPIIRDWLNSANVEDEYIDVLNFDTKVLLDDNCVQLLNKENVIGFWTAGVVKDMYNLYHFYIDPMFRNANNALGLLDNLIDSAKQKGLYKLLMHYSTTGDAANFLRSYVNLRKYKLNESILGNISIFLVEV